MDEKKEICFIPIDKDHTSLVVNNNGKITRVIIPVLDNSTVEKTQELSETK